MKEIGEKLKETRELMGISIDEVAEDLKLRPNQIEAIEIGNMEIFKDIFKLKTLIKEYAKYLGLDFEELIDEFNEYIFDYTSKIDVLEIKQEVKEIEDKNIIRSPYTIERKDKYLWLKIVLTVLVLIFLLVGGYYIYDHLFIKNNNNFVSSL